MIPTANWGLFGGGLTLRCDTTRCTSERPPLPRPNPPATDGTQRTFHRILHPNVYLPIKEPTGYKTSWTGRDTRRCQHTAQYTLRRPAPSPSVSGFRAEASERYRDMLYSRKVCPFGRLAPGSCEASSRCLGTSTPAPASPPRAPRQKGPLALAD